MQTILETSSKRLFRSVLNLALPMAWSRFIQIAGWFIGMLMVAHLGDKDLAASALINSTQITGNILFMSFLFALSVIAGRLYGEEKPDELGYLLQQGLFFALIIGIIQTVVFYWAGSFLSMTGQSPSLVAIAENYFHLFAWCSIPLSVLMSFQQFFYGILKQRLVILSNLVSLVVFILSAYVFIFGRWGFASMGIRGLAVGILIQAIFNIFLLLSAFYVYPELKRYRIFQRSKWSFHYIRQLFEMGWPISIQYGAELFAFLVLTFFTGWLGADALVAWQITTQVTLLFLVPLFAVAEAAGILISQAIGAGQMHLVEKTGQICIMIGIGVVLILSVFFFAIPNQLSAVYINIHDPEQAEALRLTRFLFYLSSISLLFDTLRNLYTGALRGFYDTRLPMWLGLVSLWVVALPLSYLMSFTWHWGVVGIRTGLIVGFFLGMLGLWWRWRYRISATAQVAPKL